MSRANIVHAAVTVKFFDWDDAQNAKARDGVRFADIAFHIERGDLRDILEHRTRTVTAASASSASDARDVLAEVVVPTARRCGERLWTEHTQHDETYTGVRPALTVLVRHPLDVPAN